MMDEKEIRILDLEEAYEAIEKSQTSGDEFPKELQAIKNAIDFINDGK